MTRFATTMLTTGLPFGLFMGMFNTFEHDAHQGLFTGVIGGVAFGLVMALVAERQTKRFAGVRGQYAPEGLVHDSAASLALGVGRSGGWLFLTKQRLVFEPHRLNVGARRVELALGEITGTRAPKGLFASRLEVTATSGETYRFIVRERDLWIAMLASAAAARTSAA